MSQESQQAEGIDAEPLDSSPAPVEAAPAQETSAQAKVPSEPSVAIWAKRLERWGIRLAVALGALSILFVVAIRLLHEPLPELNPTAEADQLARKMMAAVKVEKWQDVGAISWTFGDRRQHLWDRHRQLARVVWDQNLVLLDLETRMGIAVTEGTEVHGPERTRLEQQAWSHWCNDSFWLNPIAKVFDEGTQRGLVEVEGQQALLVQYGSGGVTPGDSYLWFVNSEGFPTRWKMWTTILPFGGIEASWDDWVTLGSGALISTRHKTALFELELTDIVAGPHLSVMVPKGDPFGPLMQRKPELEFRYQQAEEAKLTSLAHGPEPVANVSLEEVIRKAAGAEPPAED